MFVEDMQRFVATVLEGSVQAGSELVSESGKRLKAVENLQNMREAADTVHRIYLAHPTLERMSLGIYYCGPDELDFFLRDVIANGQEHEALEYALVDELSNFSMHSPVAGKLNSDGDMLRFYESITPSVDADERVLETTRESVFSAFEQAGINCLANVLFPKAWEQNLVLGLGVDPCHHDAEASEPRVERPRG